MRTADVVIVGGGVTGVSTAFHLLALGVRHVVVLERKFLGAGTAGYADAARRSGAIIEQGVEVVGISQTAGRVSGVVTAAGDEIASPVVVNAAGLWSPRLAGLVDIELPIVIGRHPVFIVE